jgi:hypothetical protein
VAGLWYPAGDSLPMDIPVRLRREGVFVPRQLPREFLLSMRTCQLLAEAERLLGQLGGIVGLMPGWRVLSLAAQLHEVRSGAELNGEHWSLRELLLAELPSSQPPQLPPIYSSYRRAADTAFRAVQEGHPVNLALLGEFTANLHADPTKSDDSSDSGQGSGADTRMALLPWTRAQRWLGGQPGFGYVLTNPDLAATRVTAEQFSEWAADGDIALPLVARLAIEYYQLAMTRPFDMPGDQLASLAVGLELTSRGVLRGQVLPLALGFHRDPAEYERQLRQVVDTGEFEPWIAYFAGVVRDVALAQVTVLDQLLNLRDDTVATLKARYESSKPHRRVTGQIQDVVTGLMTTPITNHRQLRDLHDLSRKNALDITSRLVEEGVLRAPDKQWAKTFIAPEFLNVLTRLTVPPCPSTSPTAAWSMPSSAKARSTGC